jgi:hypothetical protein
MYSEPPESLEHISDQAALPNLNSEWVNAKGEQDAIGWELEAGD